MSVHLMSAIFQTEFRDLQDAEGKITKASTAKFILLAMADHANDEGEGAYPSIESLAKKCALSEQTIRNTFDALLYNGIIYRVGTSKYLTHNHTINTSSFPASENRRDFPPIMVGVKPVEGLTGEQEGSNEYLKGVKPVDQNHYLTTHKTSDEDNSSLIPKDLVDGILELSQAPGIKREARINDILSYLGVTFRRNTSTKEWLAFAKYIDSEFQTKGWDVKQFVSWLFGQKGYNPNYWPVKKMMEFYPSAFTEIESKHSMFETLT